DDDEMPALGIRSGRGLHRDRQAAFDDGWVDRLREVQALAYRACGGEQRVDRGEIHASGPPGGQAGATARSGSISSTCFGTAADSTSARLAVTRTSSSIRRPMPRNGAGTSSASAGT